jgi:hypothetical protein
MQVRHRKLAAFDFVIKTLPHQDTSAGQKAPEAVVLEVLEYILRQARAAQSADFLRDDENEGNGVAAKRCWTTRATRVSWLGA